MSNIKLETPMSKDQVRDIISRRCPDLDLGTLGPSITASTSPWVAAMVGVNKKTISVAPMVASMKMFLLFFVICLTGIGLILYAVLAAPKQVQLAKRVKAAIEAEVTAGAATQTPAA